LVPSGSNARVATMVWRARTVLCVATAALAAVMASMHASATSFTTTAPGAAHHTGMRLPLLSKQGMTTPQGTHPQQAQHSFSSTSAVLAAAVALFGCGVHKQKRNNESTALRSRHAKWWMTNNGLENKPGTIFAARRRESRRRGEELFMHDVDNFELTLFNLTFAPGAKHKAGNAIRRGRSQYGSYGRTRGRGKRGMKGRTGKPTPGQEGGAMPMQRVHPKLTKQQRDWMLQDPYTHLDLKTLEMCEDGEQLDIDDVWMKGIPVKKHQNFNRIKITDKKDTELTRKNLTIFAHAFVPSAQDKIEQNGGKCVRLCPTRGVPVDESYYSTAA